MPFDFTCPHCKQTLEIPEEMTGQATDCPACNKEIILVEGTSAPIESSPEKTSENNCPSCEQPIASGAVICINCGYDLRTGTKFDTKIKKDEYSGSTVSEKSPIVIPVTQILYVIIFVFIAVTILYYLYIPSNVEIRGFDYFKRRKIKDEISQLKYLESYISWREKHHRSSKFYPYLNVVYKAKHYEVSDGITGKILFPCKDEGQHPSGDIKKAINGAILRDFGDFLKKSPESGEELLVLAIKTRNKKFLLQIINLFNRHNLSAKMFEPLLNLYLDENDLNVKNKILASLKPQLSNNAVITQKLMDLYDAEKNTENKVSLLATLTSELNKHPKFVANLQKTYFSAQNPILKRQILESVAGELNKQPEFLEKLLSSFFTEKKIELKVQILKSVRSHLKENHRFVKKLLDTTYNSEKNQDVKTQMLAVMASVLGQSQSLDKSIIEVLVKAFNMIGIKEVPRQFGGVDKFLDFSIALRNVEAVLKNKNIPTKQLIILTKEANLPKPKTKLANALVSRLEHESGKRKEVLNLLLTLINYDDPEHSGISHLSKYSTKILSANKEFTTEDLIYIYDNCRYNDSKEAFYSAIMTNPKNSIKDKQVMSLILKSLNSNIGGKTAKKIISNPTITMHELLYYYQQCCNSNARIILLNELVSKINDCKNKEIVYEVANTLANSLNDIIVNILQKSKNTIFLMDVFDKCKNDEYRYKYDLFTKRLAKQNDLKLDWVTEQVLKIKNPELTKVMLEWLRCKGSPEALKALKRIALQADIQISQLAYSEVGKIGSEDVVKWLKTQCAVDQMHNIRAAIALSEVKSLDNNFYQSFYAQIKNRNVKACILKRLIENGIANTFEVCSTLQDKTLDESAWQYFMCGLKNRKETAESFQVESALLKMAKKPHADRTRSAKAMEVLIYHWLCDTKKWHITIIRIEWAKKISSKKKKKRLAMLAPLIMQYRNKIDVDDSQTRRIRSTYGGALTYLTLKDTKDKLFLSALPTSVILNPDNTLFQSQDRYAHGFPVKGSWNMEGGILKLRVKEIFDTLLSKGVVIKQLVSKKYLIGKLKDSSDEYRSCLVFLIGE